MSKIALVTGAISGFGEEVVHVFAGHGWRIMASGGVVTLTAYLPTDARLTSREAGAKLRG